MIVPHVNLSGDQKGYCYVGSK